MITVMLSTLAMMAGAFAIGFAVAFLIKGIGNLLNKLETFSYTHYLLAMKRVRNIHKIRTVQIKQLFIAMQINSKDILLDYSYPNQQASGVIDYNVDNELLHYRRGQADGNFSYQANNKPLNSITDNHFLHYRYGQY